MYDPYEWGYIYQAHTTNGRRCVGSEVREGMYLSINTYRQNHQRVKLMLPDLPANKKTSMLINEVNNQQCDNLERFNVQQTHATPVTKSCPPNLHPQLNHTVPGYPVLTAVSVKNEDFRVVTSCS
jgi:hypothetical protein